MTTLQKQILEKIRTQGVKPLNKGFFRIRDYTLWTIVAVCSVALALGAGMIILMLKSIDHGLFSRLGLSLIEEFLYSVPTFWILATVVVAIAAYFNLRHTRRGYRISGKQFAIYAAIVALVLGSIIYALDISKYIDKAAHSIPLYSTMVPFDTNTWFEPDRGLLSGAVKIKTSDNSFTLRDENFDLWTISGTGVVVLPADFQFQSGDHVKIIGKKIGDFKFQAYEIRPFEDPIRKTPNVIEPIQ